MPCRARVRVLSFGNLFTLNWCMYLFILLAMYKPFFFILFMHLCSIERCNLGFAALVDVHCENRKF